MVVKVATGVRLAYVSGSSAEWAFSSVLGSVSGGFAFVSGLLHGNGAMMCLLCG